MNARPPKDDDKPVTSRDEPGVIVSRRRFTHAGLSGSVVLGSLTSKPVLGASSYQCTPSGHVSGNLSRSNDVLVCQTGSLSRSDWLVEDPWPSQIKKGTLSNDNNCNFGQGKTPGQLFNGFQDVAKTTALPIAFIATTGSSNCTISYGTSVGSNQSSATMLQVLNSTNSAAPFELGRTVIVSLLNCYKRGIVDYPVSDTEIIKMFTDTVGGGKYRVNAKASWNLAEVVEYLQNLYPAG